MGLRAQSWLLLFGAGFGAVIAWSRFQIPLGPEAPFRELKRDWLAKEVGFIANLKSRLVGTPNHDKLIDHIQLQLEGLGQKVLTDFWNFTFYDGPLRHPTLNVEGLNLHVTSWVPYSGITPDCGITGRLVDLLTSNITTSPNWDTARNAIAVTNITNVPTDFASLISVWPGSPEWDLVVRQPELAAETIILPHLVKAANAGVKAVIYIWEKAPLELIDGQYVPHLNLFSGVPAIFVQDVQSAQTLLDAARRGTSATVTLRADIVPTHQTRTIYTIFQGTELRNESMILGTHTDGLNAVEENGHIALLAQARHLAAKPPRRTTILVFIGSHLHFPAFSPPPFRGTSRWLSDHPEFWAGQGDPNSFALGGQLKSVVSTSVEHLGAVHFEADVESDTYIRTNTTEPEGLGASTAELNELVLENWVGADPNVTRVTNPNTGAIAIPGENYPYFLLGIPNVFLITAPDYLLKTWPAEFDERKLVNLKALERQVASFLRLWAVMDELPASAFGIPPADGRQTPIRVTN